MLSKCKELFGIDTRSLALFRIGLALVLLGDLFIRLQDLTAHYSDYGVLPRELLINELSDPWHFSLHLANGTTEFQFVLFFLYAIFSFALLIGYQTRVATILLWVFTLSIQARNPLVLQGGDTVLRLLLFWAIFLPLGACWSVDSLIKKEDRPVQYLSVASFALLVQICFIYWFSAVIKSDDSWRVDGTAVWLALSLEQFSTPIGQMLLQYPQLLKVATFATFYLEAYGPLFAFSPIYTGPLRMATVVIFLSFHLIGLYLTMELGHFAFVCAVAWFVFIPTWFWDRLLKPKTGATISWKTNHCSNLLAAFFISCAFLWNLRTVGIEKAYFTPQMQAASVVFRLDQYWNMFAPYPLKEDGWIVIPAKLQDGTEIDLFKNGSPVNWQKPPLISSMYKNDRWKSYILALLLDENNGVYLEQFAWYLCKEWNQNHPAEKHLQSFDIVFMMKIISLKETVPKPFEKITLWHHDCVPSSLNQTQLNAK